MRSSPYDAGSAAAIEKYPGATTAAQAVAAGGVAAVCFPLAYSRSAASWAGCDQVDVIRQPWFHVERRRRLAPPAVTTTPRHAILAIMLHHCSHQYPAARGTPALRVRP